MTARQTPTLEDVRRLGVLVAALTSSEPCRLADVDDRVELDELSDHRS
jgi:hypothetical protein